MNYNIKTKRQGFNEWTKKLPIPYSLKSVQEADKKWEKLKEIHGL